MITELSQVDKAFMDKLKGLYVQGAEAIEEVPVIYIDPEGEFKVEKYPSIIVFRSGAYPDLYRYTDDKIYSDLTYDDAGNPVSVMEGTNPEPYNIYYSVRLYYTFQRHGMLMNTHMMKTLRRSSYLEIDNEGYDISFVSYKNPNATYREFGRIKENLPREFIDQYLYKVEINVEIDSPVLKQLSTALPTINPPTLMP